MNWRRSRVNAQSQSKIQSKFQVAGAHPEVVQLLQKSHSCNWTQLQAPFLARSNNPILFFENIRSLMLKEITNLALSSIGNCAKRHVAAKRQLTVLSSPRTEHAHPPLWTCHIWENEKCLRNKQFFPQPPALSHCQHSRTWSSCKWSTLAPFVHLAQCPTFDQQGHFNPIWGVLRNPGVKRKSITSGKLLCRVAQALGPHVVIGWSWMHTKIRTRFFSPPRLHGATGNGIDSISTCRHQYQQ